MAAKPIIITRQKASDVICTMAAVNNVLQAPIYKSFIVFKNDAKNAWLQSKWGNKTNADRSERAQKNMLEELFGAGGVSASLIVPVLKKIGIGCHVVDKDDWLKMEDGIYACKMNAGFMHAVAKRGNYIIDSIDGEIYKWKGFVQGGRIEYAIAVYLPK